MSSTFPTSGGVPSLPCQRCGLSFPLNEAYCPRCGYYRGAPSNPVASAPSGALSNGPQQPLHPSWGQSPSSSLQNPGQGWGQPRSGPAQNPGQGWGQPAVGPMQSSFPAGFPSAGPGMPQPNGSMPGMAAPFSNTGWPPQSPSSVQLPSTPFPMQPPAQLPSTPFPMQSPAFGQPLAAGGAAGNAPARKLNRKSVGVIVAVVLLAAVGLSVFGFVFQGSQDGTSLTGLGPTPGGPLKFADTFADNSKGWDLQSENGAFSIALDHGALVLEDDHNKLLPETVPGTTTKPLDDFQLTLDAVLSRGDPDNGYGVDIRGSSDQYGNTTNCYRIEFYGDGSYAIFKIATDANGVTTATRLVDYTTTSALKKQGQVNHISITARGTTIMVNVNGVLIKTVTDKSYRSGAVELFVSNLAGAHPGAQARFSHLAIYGV